TTYLWLSNLPVAVQNAIGQRTTFSFAALPKQTQMLQGVTDPRGGRFTHLYDANGRVAGLIDGVGNRSTLLWDGSGNRKALIDALGNRTTYVYSAGGLLT